MKLEINSSCSFCSNKHGVFQQQELYSTLTGINTNHQELNVFLTRPLCTWSHIGWFHTQCSLGGKVHSNVLTAIHLWRYFEAPKEHAETTHMIPHTSQLLIVPASMYYLGFACAPENQSSATNGDWQPINHETNNSLVFLCWSCILMCRKQRNLQNNQTNQPSSIFKQYAGMIFTNDRCTSSLAANGHNYSLIWVKCWCEL